MPRPRAGTRPPPPTPEERKMAALRALWRPLRRWKDAVHREAWRTAIAENGATARRSISTAPARP